MASWAMPYVGIPFEPHGRTRAGCDCWGLTRLVLAERFKLALPLYLDYPEPSARAEVAGEIQAHRNGWRSIMRGREKQGDTILLTIHGAAMHLATVVAPGLMLHVMRGTNACVEAYQVEKWEKRIEGFYRHEGLE